MNKHLAHLLFNEPHPIFSQSVSRPRTNSQDLEKMGQGRSTMREGGGDAGEFGKHYEAFGARNKLFELTQSIAPGNYRRNGHNQLYQGSAVVVKAVQDNDFETLQIEMDSISSASSENLQAIKTDVATFVSEDIGWNVFHYAADHESDSIMEELVKHLKDSDSVNGKTRNSQEYTALHMAVRSGNLCLVTQLLKHPRIDVNLTDVDDWTPLHHACFRGFTEITLALVNADFYCRNQEGDSPLHLAASNLHTSIFTALHECEPFCEKYHRKPEFLGLKDQDGNTLLNLAVDGAENELIEWCLTFGFSTQMVNNKKMNCMHIAARRGNLSIAMRILEVAKTEGGNISKFVNSASHFRSTPLYIAAKFGNVEVIKFLLDNGAVIECKTMMHYTPLLAAIRYTKPQSVHMLLSRGADMMVKDRRRNYNAILWAVEIQNPDILKMLVKHAYETPDISRRVWKETDSQKNTAHHIAAKAKNLDMLKILVQHNTSCLEEKNNDGLTPFHIAVREGKMAIMNYIISSAANATYIVDSQDKSGLHMAAEFGHTSITERLITVHSSENSVCFRDRNGWTSLHLAAKNGHTDTLKFLLQHSQLKDTCEILDNNHHTALYLACINGHPKCVDLLIEWGAMVTYNYHCRDDVISMSCLMAAIDSDHGSVVSTILKSNKWRQSLQFCSKSDSKEAETPLRKLIKKMPAAAKIVFDRCVQNEKIEDKRGSYCVKVHYKYDFVEDFQDLYEDQGPKITDDGSSTEQDSANTSRATPLQLQESQALRRQDTIITNQYLTHQPSTFSTTMRREDNRRDNIDHFEHHEPKASPRKRNGLWGPVEFQYKNHPLHLMVLHKRQELLKHRLVASFIHHKWNLFGRWIYYPNVAIYTLLMLLLTAYIYLRFDYSKLLIRTYEKQTNTSLSLSDCSQNISLDFLNTTDDVVETLHGDKNRLITCSVIIILNCLARIAIEVVQIIHHRGEYFLQYINYLEGFLYVATIVFVSNFQLQCLPSWQWQLGAMCIFLSWINFILFLSEQPVVGIYVVMFQDIIKTFLRMAPMAVLLVLAFGQPFFMLLSVVDVESPPQQFLTFPYSLLKTVAMTTGELETDHIFFSTPSVVTYPFITYLLWILFLIIMPILLQNLLVGLAVDDIKSVQEKAALKKEALQIEFILDVLSRMPKPLVRWRNRREFIQTWGKNPVDKFWKWLSGSYWKPDLKSGTSYEDTVAAKVERMTELVSTMERRMQSLTEQNAKLEKLILHFSHEQERYFEPLRQEQLHRMRSFFHSESNLFEHEVEREGEGGLAGHTMRRQSPGDRVDEPKKKA